MNTTKYKTIHLITFMLAILSHISLVAQNGPAFHITGNIKDMEGKDVDGASVILQNVLSKEIVLTAVSKQNGNFRLTAGKGKYQVIISYIGFSQFLSDTLTLAGDLALGTIKLQNSHKTLDEILVKGEKRQPLIESDARKLVYNIAKSPNAQGSNALEALKRIPGIQVDQNNLITIDGGKGVLVMINGRQTYLQAQDIANLLKSTPSSGIRSIEVINNPSAEYDAEGSGGIVNIIMQKTSKEGFSGSFNNGLAYGVSLKENSDLNFNYRTGKVNIFGNYSDVLGHFAMDYSNDRILGGLSYINPIHDVDKRNTTSAGLGLDYEINNKESMGCMLNGNFIYGPGLISPDTYIFDTATKQLLQKLVSTSNYYQQHANRYDANINYRYQDTLGKILSFDADYGYFDDGTKNLNTNNWFSPDGTPQSTDIYRTISSNGINMYALSGNYQNKAGKGTLKLGAKYSSVSANNNLGFYTVNNNIDVIDTNQSNFFSYTEQIAAAYAQYEGPLAKDLSYDMGLRLENTHSTGILTPIEGSNQEPSTIKRNYLDLFPTVSVTFKTEKTGSYSLSYIKRIDRPAYKDLNPFQYPIDELSYWQGNPFLQPQYAQTLSIQYSYAKTILQLEYTYTNHLGMQVTELSDSNKIGMIPENIGAQNNLGLHLVQQLSPAKWWEASFSAIGYFLANRVDLGQLGNYDPQRFAGTVSTEQIFKLPMQITADLNGTFNSRTLSGPIGICRAYSQIDLGFQRNVCKDRGILRLACTDIYQGNKLNTVSQYTGLYVHTTFSGEYRQIRLNFTYKFGNTTNQAPKEHDSGLKNENQRL
jgi:outer membrane beta-barrel protein/carboxypeptidase family protein/TonB-dependent receptor-like protein